MEWLPDAPGSGVARMFHGLSTHLPEEHVAVTGLVTGESEPDRESICAFASAAESLPHRLWRLRAALDQVVADKEPDLIAAHFALYALPAWWAISRMPFVMHFHGPWGLESEAEGASTLSVWVKSWIEHLVYHRAHRFIVLSEAFRTVLVEEFGLPADLIRIVPGGVQVDRFDTAHSPQAARSHLGWPQDRPVILSVRRLVHRVGLFPLVEAMSTVVQYVPDACLLIAGKGPLASELQAHINARGLDHHVRLLGFVPDSDLPLAYRAADVSIVPTQSLEGFGLIAAESLAAGTPALVTPVGGLPEVVQDLSTELIMRDASSDSIAEHLTAALRGDLSLPSAEDCRAFAARKYDWPVIARQTRSVYEDVI